MESSSAAQLVTSIRTALTLRLTPEAAASLQWSGARLPTVTNVSRFGELGLVPSELAARLFQRFDFPTTVESSKGNARLAAQNLRDQILSLGADTDVDSLAILAQSEMQAADQALGTRQLFWRLWCGVITWGVALGCVERILPMPVGILRALVIHLLALDGSGHYVMSVVSAIQDRHRKFSFSPPVDGRFSMSVLRKGVLKFTGAPRSLKFPIQRSHVVRLLSFGKANIVVARNCLLVATMTICCLRASEAAALQVCDLWFDFDLEHSGDARFQGTAAVLVRHRKNDQLRKSHFPRIGRSRDAELDLVHQLRTFLSKSGLRVAAGCCKRARRQDCCPLCPPLFPNSRQGSAGSLLTGAPLTRQRVRDITLRTMELLGFDKKLFSGISARKGGLSVAIEGGVPEHILWMQSGHAQSLAARRYVQLSSPNLLYSTWQAFDL